MNLTSSMMALPTVLSRYQLAAILALLLLASAPDNVARAQTDANGQLGPNGQIIAAAVNQARVDAGLVPLALNPQLSIAAQAHVNDMIASYRYGHQGSDGSYAAERVARTGYSDSPWVSENWVSARDPSGAMRWWMSDYVHRVNILAGRWVEVGVGVGRRPDSSEMLFVTVFSAGTDEQGAVLASVPAANAAPAPPPPQIQPVPPGGLDYTVRPGDTLLGIALQFGLDWQTVASKNGLAESSLIQIGQVVHIPGPELPATNSKGDASLLQGADNGAVEYSRAYTVQPGDTLFTIAARNGITWQQLSSGNGLGEQSVLQIGQVIYLPAAVAKDVTVALAAPPAMSLADTNKPAPISSNATPYIVQAGDTIISIAFRHGLDLQELMATNGFDDDTLLQPGQTIRLP